MVARGRYVEIATERDEPVCGGTAAYMDRVIEAAAHVIGATLPEGQFVRFEWHEFVEDDPIVGGGLASFADHGVLIRSDVHLLEEHELVHAVQMQAWPLPNDFLFEGLAVLLDAKRMWKDAYAWPETSSLDALLESPNLASADYDLAWFIVSQIVLDHGFEGLREFWYAVPRGSSAGEVRAAYQALFGRPIDALLEPYEVGEPGTPGSYEIERRACDFALCPAASVTPWEGDLWSAVGPTGCEDDVLAIGPDRRSLSETGEVWRDATMPGAAGFYLWDIAGAESFSVGLCALNCENIATGLASSSEGPYLDMPQYRNWSGPLRVEVRAALSDLPTDTPATLEMRRVPPP